MPASAIGIILDPSEVATNRTELNINSGAIRIASEGPNWGDAAIAAAIADRKFGSVPVGYRIPNRIVTIPLIVRAVSGTTFNQAQTKLQQKVARFQDEGGWLKRVSSDGTTKLYADVVNASLTFPDPRFQDVEGGVILTLECLPDFYGDEQASGLVSALDALEPLALFAPDPDTGTVIDRTGNYTATLTNGASVTSDELVSGAPGAISLDGTNDYVSTTFGTRRNLCPNPSFETNTTGWTFDATGYSAASLVRSTSDPSYGAYSAQLLGTKAANATWAYILIQSDQIAVTAGQSYSLSFQSKVYGGGDSHFAQIVWLTSGGSFISYDESTHRSGSGTVSMTATAPPTAAYAYIKALVQSNTPSQVINVFFDGFLFERASSVGPYFDGSGYVNGSGTWVASSGTICGWLGTAHASASDYGVYSNGTVRTVVAVAQRTATADADTLWASSSTSSYPSARWSAGGSTLTVSTNQSEIESATTVAASTPALIAVEFSDAGNTVKVWRNGTAHGSSPFAHTAQFAATQTFQIGAYGTGSDPFDGLIGPVAVFDRALTAEEHATLGIAAGVGGSSSGDNDSLVFTEQDIPGDYPARSRYTFTDTGSQARQAVLIASQARTYDADNTAALAYEAEALTPLDAAAIVTKSGAHGGASNNGVAHATISPSWIGVLSTQHDTYGHLTHWGNYRVFARVWSYLGETQARLEYAVGDSAARRINPTVTIPSDSGFYIADFGEVRLNKVSTGTQQWMGAFFARSDDSGVAFGIDKIWLAPTESLTICKARQGSSTSAASLPLSTDYRDSFIQSSGNLSGKTADRGGNWTTAGSTTDFTIETTLDRAQRTTTSDSDMRFGVIGSAHTATYAAVDFLTDNFTTGMWQGLVLRYVDTSNFIAAIRYYSGTENRIDIIERVAGVTTVLLEQTLSAQPTGGFKRIVAGVATSGRVEVLFDGNTYSAVCTAAATGGALDDGKVGIIDYNPSATAATRQWDNFVGSSVTADSACRSGGVLSACFDGSWRETSTSGIYAPAYVEGSHPRAPASGLESRTCRTLILPSAGDFDTLPDTDPLAFSVRSYHRPAYLFAPEE